MRGNLTTYVSLMCRMGIPVSPAAVSYKYSTPLRQWCKMYSEKSTYPMYWLLAKLHQLGWYHQQNDSMSMLLYQAKLPSNTISDQCAYSAA